MDTNNNMTIRGYGLIGGWLILFVINIIFSIISSVEYVIDISIPLLFGDLWGEIQSNAEHVRTFLGEMMVFESILHIINISFILFFAFNWFRRKMIVPKLVIRYISFAIFFVLSELFYTMEIDMLDFEYLLSTLFQLLLMVIWMIYFMKSKRVKNTFVNI